MTTFLAALGLAAGALGSLSLAAAGPAAADGVEPFGKRYDASLYGDFTTIGNTVARERSTARSMIGDYGSSTGRLTIPAGAEVTYARLFWGGNDGTYRAPNGAQLPRCALSGSDLAPSPDDHATAAPHLRVGAGPETPVSIDSMVTDPAETDGPHHYTGESDVTAAFAGVRGTDVRVAVGNIWAPNGKGCVAGWSLTVVHSFPGPEPTHAKPSDAKRTPAEPTRADPTRADPTRAKPSDAKPAHAPGRRHVYVYGGHVLQRPTSPATTIAVDGFQRTAGAVRASVTAYGGDRNTPGSGFLVNGETVTESRTGHTGHTGQGIDTTTFTVPDGAIPVGARSAELAFTPAGGTYLASALAFSVPVPDLMTTDAASPKQVKRDHTPTPTLASPPVDTADPAPTATATSASASASADTDVEPTPVTTPPRPRSAPHGPSGSMAETGGNGERLWLLGGLALALAATGLVAKAALRGRREL